MSAGLYGWVLIGLGAIGLLVLIIDAHKSKK